MEIIKKVLDEMSNVDISAMLLLKPVNIYYMTNFKPSSFSILLLNEEPILWVSKMDKQEAEENSTLPFQVFKSIKDFQEILNQQDIHQLGVEESLPVSFCSKINDDFKIEICDIIERLRMIKTPPEIRSIEKAIEIAETSFKQLGFKGEEWELAAKLEYLMRINGSQKQAFDTIVASGTRSSIPHAQPSHNLFEYPLTIDWGAVWGNYSSDCTRTLIHDDQQEEILNIILEAQKQAIKVIKPGIKVCDVDDAARTVIKDYGYENNFIHSTGHGVGLEVQEKPSISFRDDTILEKNMVITIEPGIYFEGKWGVRVEDMVIVKNRAKKISKLPSIIDLP